VAQRGIRVLVKEVPQRRDEMPGMRNIVPANRCTDVIDEHVSDVVRSVLAVEQRSAEHNRYSIGNMLVLGNGVRAVQRSLDAFV